MAFTLQPILARGALSTTYGKNIAVNPYQGCVFACQFCSAIKMNFFTGRTKEKWDKTGWGNWLDYKTKLVELLYKERERFERREAKIVERKNKINSKTVEKIVEKNDGQLSLFDL